MSYTRTCLSPQYASWLDNMDGGESIDSESMDVDLVKEFHKAISSNNDDKVLEMLTKNKNLAMADIKDEKTIRDVYPKSDVTKDFYIYTDSCLTPLEGVGISGSVAIAKHLLCSEISNDSLYLAKALACCTINDNHEVAKEIIQYNVEAINTVAWDNTALYWAAWFDAAQTGEVLLSMEDVLVNEGDNMDRDTPLHMAVYRQSTKMLKLLLDNPKVEVNALNRQEETPLYYAANQKNKNMEHVKLLIEHGANISKKSRWGKPPPFSKEEYEEILNNAIKMSSDSSKF